MVSNDYFDLEFTFTGAKSKMHLFQHIVNLLSVLTKLVLFSFHIRESILFAQQLPQESDLYPIFWEFVTVCSMLSFCSS